MKANLLDLRRRPGEILKALDQNEPVALYYRGRKKGVIYSAAKPKPGPREIKQHPAFGLWKDRKDLADVERAIDEWRKERFRDL